MNRFESRANRIDEARLRIDAYYAAVLGCQVSDLRASGWTSLVSRFEDDPMTLLFGMRQVVYLLAPVCEGSGRAGPAGVASLAAELHAGMEDLLNTARPGEFFRPESLLRLDRLVRDGARRPLAPSSEAWLSVFYATRGSFQPYLGPWVEWIERLDESTESDPFALALLARHGGGVFVVRHHGSIIAYCGLRAFSSDVWELTPPCLTASVYAQFVKRPDALFTALLARATRAAVDDNRVPICTISHRATRLRRALLATGYLRYANASVYATIAP